MLLFRNIQAFHYRMKISLSWTIGVSNWREACLKNFPMIGPSVCQGISDIVKMKWFLWMSRKERCHGSEEPVIHTGRHLCTMRSGSSDLKKIWKIILIGVAPNREM